MPVSKQPAQAAGRIPGKAIQGKIKTATCTDAKLEQVQLPVGRTGMQKPLPASLKGKLQWKAF